eukprot:9500109-Pyramimonas_sp.AAC.1
MNLRRDNHDDDDDHNDDYDNDHEQQQEDEQEEQEDFLAGVFGQKNTRWPPMRHPNAVHRIMW